MINTFMEPVLRRRYARVFLEIAGEGGLFAEQIGMFIESNWWTSCFILTFAKSKTSYYTI